MTKQEFLELYGKSVYQVRLEIFLQLLLDPEGSFDGCLEIADSYIAGLLKEDLKELKQSYD